MLRGPYYYEDKENDLVAHINETEDGVPYIEFEEKGERFATIHYPENSLAYVEDAAMNYIMGIFKREDVLRHANKQKEVVHE